MAPRPFSLAIMVPFMLAVVPVVVLAVMPWGVASTLAEETRFERRAFPLTEPAYGVDRIDVNADGQPDMVVVGYSKVWAVLAPGKGGDWRVRQIAETPGGRTIHAVSLDCDGDGDLDLCISRSASFFIQFRLATSQGKKPKQPEGNDFTVAWLENPGAKGKQAASKPWKLHILDRELHGVHGLWTGDIDGDGVNDLIANSFAGPHLESSLAWFKAPKPSTALKAKSGMGTGMGKRRMITTGKATGRPHYMGNADMNGDGRMDVLLGASREGSFTWWEQPPHGKDAGVEWKRHLIANTPGATHPRPHDLNGDGKLDVIGSAGHDVGVYWYEAPSWKQHVIDKSIRDVHAFDTADIDGDGDIDAAGCSFSQGIVRWWENRGGGRFVAHDIDVDNQQQAYDVKLLDMDGDGKPELLLAGRASKNVVIYHNKTRR